MRIHYFSDIHLEFGHLPVTHTQSDVVIAAGDIGLGKQGVEWLKGFKKPVIYVAGNHEFYTQEYKSTLDLLRQSCAGTHIQFLEKETFIYRGVRFIGCTLWTDLLKNGEKRAFEVGLRLNDFRAIRFKDQAFDPAAFSQLYRRSLLWLENELDKAFAGKTVVITHHAPSNLSWQERGNDLKRMAYCNDLQHLFEKHDIAAWFHGHIHTPNDYYVSETRVLSNPRGYAGRKLVEGFNPAKTILI